MRGVQRGKSSRPPAPRARAADPLVGELTTAVNELRGALADVIADLRADPHRPLSLGRSLGVDKSLAWKVSKVLRASDAGHAVQHLPGSAAFEILVSAVERRGAPARSIDRLRNVAQSINRIVTHHVDDRPTLELVLDGLPAPAQERLQLSRKLAFRGNSGIWGVQAKTRVNTAIVAPSRGKHDFVDQAMIGGWVDFRRLRAETRWALFRRRQFNTASGAPPTPAEPIDKNEPLDGPMLIREFCSSTLPPIEVVQDPEGDLVHELGASAVGNAGAFTCFFGSVLRQIGSRYAEDKDDYGEFGAIVSAPVERLQFDLLAHRDCAFALDASVSVYGTLGRRVERDRLPLDVKPAQLGGLPPVMDSPHVPRYGQLIDHVLERCGWKRRDFIALRYVLEYPPFPSSMVIHFPLQRRS